MTCACGHSDARARRLADGKAYCWLCALALANPLPAPATRPAVRRAG